MPATAAAAATGMTTRGRLGFSYLNFPFLNKSISAADHALNRLASCWIVRKRRVAHTLL